MLECVRGKGRGRQESNSNGKRKKQSKGKEGKTCDADVSEVQLSGVS